MPELRFDNVKKNYGDKQALRGVSFTLKEGFYGLLGPNGAGKSTLLPYRQPARHGRVYPPEWGGCGQDGPPLPSQTGLYAPAADPLPQLYL